MEHYRRDVDGLRALAVVAVVLYHAGVKTFGGGYVGVDVFFVISGYLITGYVNSRVRERKFSIVEFYERRVRRIMPALLFLLIACSGLGYFCLLPDELYRLAKSQVATIGFAPNILLFREAGYFDASARLKPLLHMWSLGVEEQFYIFLPLTIMAAARAGRRGVLATLWGGSAISLALSIWAVHNAPSAAFYLVPFRAWELLLGSLLAVRAFPRTSNRIVCNALSAGGVLLVVASLFAYSSNTPFPGLAAMLPCLGTALAIHGSEERSTLMGKFLSWNPVVGVGLISYSLYLWHWPLLVFGEQFLGRPLTRLETLTVILLSVIVAILSWKFVEQPFRHRVVGRTRGTLFAEAAVLATAVVVLACVGILRHGLPGRLPPEALQYASGTNDRDPELSGCRSSVEQIQNGDWCRFGAAKSEHVDFVVWGDSHADSLAPAFKSLARETGSAGWLAVHPGCAPLLDVNPTGPDAAGCREFNDAVIAAVERHNIPAVFLVGRWEVNVLGRTKWETEEGLKDVFLLDSQSRGKSAAESVAAFQRGLHRSLSRLDAAGRKAFVVMDVPNTAIDTPEFLAKSIIRGRIGHEPEIRIDVAAQGGRVGPVDDLVLRIARQWHATTIDPKFAFCNGPECLVAKGGESLYRDDHHLSVVGALQLVDLIRPSLVVALNSSGSSRTVAAFQRNAQPQF